MNNKALHMVTWILLVVGGLNWGLVGLMDLNLVAKLGEGIAMIVYILVGLSALYEIFTHKKNCSACRAM